MEHNRSQKLLMIIALVAGIASLSVGFAAFSVSLNISSSASVNPSSDTFSVKFSTSQNSLVIGAVTPSSKTPEITASDGIIDNLSNPTIKNLSVTFTQPGQYVEYVFYVRNEGEYTAYLNNINFLGDKKCTAETGTTDYLVQSACEDINITATVAGTTYTETTPITGHSLAKKAGEEIKIKLEYSATATSVDGPFLIKIPNLALVYSTLDNSTIEPTIVSLISGDINTVGSIVAIGCEKFYVYGHENGNVKLLSMYNLYVGNSVSDNSWTATPLNNQTGIQDETARGYLDGKLPFIGTTAFSSNSQKGTSYNDYEGSIVEGYVNNYKNYLEGQGVIIEEARLITFDELEILGCNGYAGSCSDAPSWVYLTSYWSGSASGTQDVFRVLSDGNCGYYYYYDDAGANGVRPVIIISESEF